MTLIEWLRRVPPDLCWTEPTGSHVNIALGKFAHAAADELEDMSAELKRLHGENKALRKERDEARAKNTG